MGKPAARVGDMHTCPKSEGTKPHVGGPIAKGAPNVYIEKMPAARVGDQAVCVGPPDKISQGSGTVFIKGKEAARIGDQTEHQGVIVKGAAKVSIG